MKMKPLSETVWEAWAPDGARWSPWCKPVLFAHLDYLPQEPSHSAASLYERSNYLRELRKINPMEVALILDLPSARAVYDGAALASDGWRPVPLYNCVPEVAAAPASLEERSHIADVSAAINAVPIMEALAVTAQQVAVAALSLSPAPVFLLDSRRRTETGGLSAGRFDNRWISLPSDFPSANFLLGHGIKSVVVVQAGADAPQADLAHTLLRWQEAGMHVHLLRADAPECGVVPIVVQRPKWYRSMFYRFLATLGLRQHPLGGFGGRIPIPQAHAG